MEGTEKSVAIKIERIVDVMKYSYYPGCTLRTKAKKLDDYARASAKALGFELEEADPEEEASLEDESDSSSFSSSLSLSDFKDCLYSSNLLYI